jgi:large subunit ribosomal protein L22
MVGYQYSFKAEENMAKAVGRNISISFKQAVEVCHFIRGKPLETAKMLLGEVLKKKTAVPYKRYKHKVGHKTKIGPGRYPAKASIEILKIIESAEANAQFKGLSAALVVKHAAAQKGAKTMRYGRRGRRGKNTNIEIILAEEKEAKKEQKPGKAGQKKKEEKVEQK